MGTRSLTIVTDEQDQTVLCLYRQYDGYIEGHGDELATFLKRRRIVNGFSGSEKQVANGMSCLAAQIVSFFKKADTPGGFYLYPPGTSDVGEEFTYTVSFNKLNESANLKIESLGKVLFDDLVSEFNLESFSS